MGFDLQLSKNVTLMLWRIYITKSQSLKPLNSNDAAELIWLRHLLKVVCN